MLRANDVALAGVFSLYGENFYVFSLHFVFMEKTFCWLATTHQTCIGAHDSDFT